MARNHRDLQPDLNWLEQLPGTKVLGPGNHDGWWNGVEKIRPMLRPSQLAVGGDAIATHGAIVCGARGEERLDDDPTPAQAAESEHELNALDTALLAAATLRPGHANHRCSSSGTIRHSISTDVRASVSASWNGPDHRVRLRPPSRREAMVAHRARRHPRRPLRLRRRRRHRVPPPPHRRPAPLVHVVALLNGCRSTPFSHFFRIEWYFVLPFLQWEARRGGEVGIFTQRHRRPASPRKLVVISCRFRSYKEYPGGFSGSGTTLAFYKECLKSAWAVAEGVDIGFTLPSGVIHAGFEQEAWEKIVIGENIVVTVVKIDRNQIRLGIEAPHEVSVYREEIAQHVLASRLPTIRSWR